MITNPEIQKCKWLEFSQHRLVMMPVAIAMVFFLAYQTNMTATTISNIAMTIFVAFVVVWGGGKAAESVLEEVNDNTWDFQRLSSLSPSVLAFGKLIGGPIYCWYGGVILVLLYVISSLQYKPTYIVLCNTTLLVLAGLICHSGALLSSLQSLQSVIIRRRKIGRFGHLIVGIVLSLSLCIIPVAKNYTRERLISWYSFKFESTGFAVALSIIILFWLLVGIYTQMRKQLRMQVTPTAWITFVIFTMFFCSGFVYETKFDQKYDANTARWLQFFVIGIIFTYAMAFFENWNGISYKRLLDCWKSGNKNKLYEIFPRWLITLSISFVVGILIGLSYLATSQIIIFLAIISIFCFVIRDIAILHYF